MVTWLCGGLQFFVYPQKVWFSIAVTEHFRERIGSTVSSKRIFLCCGLPMEAVHGNVHRRVLAKARCPWDTTLAVVNCTVYSEMRTSIVCCNPFSGNIHCAF